MFKGKKAISEITAFIFLTLLIVSGSTAAYFYSQGIIEDSIHSQDKEYMESFLRNLNYKIENSLNFHGETFSTPINFQSGTFVVRDNQVYYQSHTTFEQEESVCVDGVCHVASGGNERLYFNLTQPWEFSDNLTLIDGGSHILTFELKENVSEIKVYAR